MEERIAEPWRRSTNGVATSNCLMRAKNSHGRDCDVREATAKANHAVLATFTRAERLVRPECRSSHGSRGAAAKQHLPDASGTFHDRRRLCWWPWRRWACRRQGHVDDGRVTTPRCRSASCNAAMTPACCRLEGPPRSASSLFHGRPIAGGSTAVVSVDRRQAWHWAAWRADRATAGGCFDRLGQQRSQNARQRQSPQVDNAKRQWWIALSAVNR